MVVVFKVLQGAEAYGRGYDSIVGAGVAAVGVVAAVGIVMVISMKAIVDAGVAAGVGADTVIVRYLLYQEA